MSVTKIVITGGPCAGKSTAMSWIQNEFTKRGFTVLFIAETATELLSGGITSVSCQTSENFQKLLMKLQMEKEAIYENAVGMMNSKKILIVCDRGMLDNKAYMQEEVFTTVLERLGVNEVEIRDNYDAVFHLVTAAKGALQYYTTENNPVRTETPEEAACLDDKLIAAWTGHPHLRIIDNSTDFKNKMRRLMDEIAVFLGEPMPYETERKFLIEYPDINWLENNPKCKRVEIMQTYLFSNCDGEVRIRQRGYKGSFVYFQTIKHKVSESKRVEIERRLSKEEYLRLLLEADTSRKPIRKTRYCLTYENQYFEIDVYPFWSDKAIAEIELSSLDQEIVFPEQIKVIKEVTNDVNYKNATLAKMI